jgi:hypothetical protein
MNVKDIEVMEDISGQEEKGFVVESDAGYVFVIDPEISPELL